MTQSEPTPRKNWFDAGGSNYARFRPEYPPALASFLAGLAPDRALAVDVGCGNGQLTAQLAAHFDEVIGVDPSADQIANAKPASGASYLCAPAEKLPVPDGAASLVAAAQAAHWFDLPQFFTEARRIAAPGAVIALVSYGILRLEPALHERFDQFYWKEIGPYWPPERKLVDTGYADIAFPFRERPAAEIAMEKHWTLDELLGYISTWSAVRQAREAGKEHMLTAFAADLAAMWGDPGTRRLVAWPLNMRLGQL